MLPNLSFSKGENSVKGLQLNCFKKCKNYCNFFRPITDLEFSALHYNQYVSFYPILQNKNFQKPQCPNSALRRKLKSIYIYIYTA